MCWSWNHSTQRAHNSSFVRSKQIHHKEIGQNNCYWILLSFVLSVTNLLPTVEVAWLNTEYQHQDSGITNTQFTWLLLNNCSIIYERDPSTFYNLSRYFGRKLHYIKVGQRGREIQWVGFPIWNKCGAMSRTCHKTWATWNIWFLKASKHIHKKWSS
jgi:hypothetical protein